MRMAKNEVGPVLTAHRDAEVLVTAIQTLNAKARIMDCGSYWRVLVPERCLLTRAALEAAAGGEPLAWPDVLETVMTSFKGRLHLSQDEAVWSLEKGPA